MPANKKNHNLLYFALFLIPAILFLASPEQLICASCEEPIIWELEKIRQHIAWPDGTLRVYYKTVEESDRWFFSTLGNSSKLLTLMVVNYPLETNLFEFLKYRGLLGFSDLVALNMCWDAINWVGESGTSEQEVLARKVACMYCTRLQEASEHLPKVLAAFDE